MPNTGYHVDSIFIDGVLVPPDSQYMFSNVQASHAIRVTFLQYGYALSASAGPNGSIIPSGNIAVNFGADTTFIFVPGVGYHVDSIIVDGIFAEIGRAHV